MTAALLIFFLMQVPKWNILRSPKSFAFKNASIFFFFNLKILVWGFSVLFRETQGLIYFIHKWNASVNKHMFDLCPGAGVAKGKGTSLAIIWIPTQTQPSKQKIHTLQKERTVIREKLFRYLFLKASESTLNLDHKSRAQFLLLIFPSFAFFKNILSPPPCAEGDEPVLFPSWPIQSKLVTPI